MPDKRKDTKYAFRDGSIYIADDRGQIHVKVWPNPAAHTMLWHNKWKPYSPEFRLVSPERKARKECSDQMLFDIATDLKPANIPFSPRNKNRAFAALRSTLPPEVAEVVQVFRSHQWNIIRFAFFQERLALDLLQSNPALAFILANHKGYSQMISIPEQKDKAQAIACLKQKELLKRLKYPGTKAMVNLTKKLRPESVTPDNLEALRVNLTDKTIAEHLSRMDIINAGVMGILGNAKVAGTYDHRLLREVATVKKENYYPFTMHTIEEVCYMCKNTRPRQHVPVFSSLKRLEEFHDEVSAAFVRVSAHKLRYCKIPKPPIPGTDTILPLNTALKIQKEGEHQHNCVGSYAPRVAQGGLYLYKVTAPERATLEIVRDAGGTWRMGELRRERNQDVRHDTVRAVEEWIEVNTVSA